MQIPDYLTRDPDGHIHLTGHRISLDDVVHFFNEGELPEILYGRFPTVPLSTFYRVIAFYLDNRPAVNEYCSANQARLVLLRRAASNGFEGHLRHRTSLQRPLTS